MNFLKAMFGNYSKREVKRVQPICDKVLALEDKYAAMSESELKNQTTILKERLANGETTDDILPEAFATCREAGMEGAWYEALPRSDYRRYRSFTRAESPK